MVTTLKEIKLTETTSSFEVEVKLDPKKSFQDYLVDYHRHLDKLDRKKLPAS